MKSIVTAVALFAATPAFAHHNGYINPTTGQREYTDDNYEYRGWSGGGGLLVNVMRRSIKRFIDLTQQIVLLR